MNENLIQLQAKLDEAKSRNNINGDIVKLQNQLNHLKLQAELNPKAVASLTREIEKAVNQKITISNVEIDDGQATKNARQTKQKNSDEIKQIAINNLISSANSAIQGKSSKSSILTTVLATLADIGITYTINEISNLMSDYANRVDNAKDALEEFNNASEESKKELNTQTEWIEENGEAYENLANGVDKYGNNISLTTDEFSKYNSLTKEIAELFPDMVQGYDNQNRAILRNKGNVEELTKSYERNTQAYYASVRAKSGEAFDNYKTAISDDRKSRKQLDSLINEKNTIAFQDIPFFVDNDFGDIFDNSTKDLLRKELNEMDRDKSGNYISFNFSDFSVELQQKILDVYTTIQNAIDSETEKFLPSLEAFLYGNSSGYGKLDNESKEAVQTFVKNLNDSVISKFDNDNELHSWIKKNVIQPLQDGANESDLAIRFQTLFSLSQEDFDNYQDYVNAVTGIINALSEMKGKDGGKLFSKEQLDSYKRKMGITGYDGDGNPTGQKLIDNVKNKFKGVKNSEKFVEGLSEDELRILNQPEANKKTSVKDMRSFIDEKIKGDTNKSKNVSDTTSKTFSQVWDSIGTTGNDETKKELQEEKRNILELAEAGKLTEKQLSNSSIADIFKDAGISIEEATEKINKFADNSKQLDTMQIGIRAIKSAYDEKKDSKKHKVSLSTLDSMYDTLGVEDWDDANKKVWENYKKNATDGKKSTADMEKAQNQLASSFVSSNNFLANLDETNIGYYKTLLTEMGVANANEIATNALNQSKAVSALESENLSDMSSKEITSLIDEKAKTEDAAAAMRAYAFEKLYANGNALDTTEDITQLMNLLEAFGIAAPAIKRYRDYLNGDYNTSEPGGMDPEYLRKEAEKEGNAVNNKLKKLIDRKKDDDEDNSDKKDEEKTKGKSSVQKEPKQEINWMDRKITALNNKLSETQKLYDAIAAAMKKANSSAMVKKENANLNEQIRTLRKLRSAYGKQASKYQSKANKYAEKYLSKDLQSKVKNGKIKGTYSELVAQYGEPKAKQIQKAIDLYNNASTARQNKADVNKQINDAKIRKYQNRADLAQSRIDKNAARAELKPLSKKNKYIDNEITHTRALYKYQIRIARRNGDNEEVAKLKAERGKKIRDYKVEKHQNRADLAQSRIDKNAARAELVHLSKKNKYIDKEIEHTQTLYKHKIKIAKLNGDKEEAAKLEAECQKTVRDLEVEKLQNLADENEASHNLKATEASMTTDYRKKNQLSREGTASLKKQYKYLMDIAEKEGDITEKKRLQLEMAEKLNEESKERVQNVIEDYENRLIGNNRQMQVWNNGASLAEAKGYTVSGKFYDQMAETAEESAGKHKEGLDKAWDQYYQEMEIHKNDPGFFNSQQWHDIIKAINSEADAWEQDRISAEKYKQQAIQAHWGIADSAKQAIDYLNDEAETYKSILGYKDMYDKNGVLTDAGTATFALDVYGIENNIEKFKKINEEIDELNELYKAGKISPEVYNKRMQELKDNAMSTVESIYSIRDSMKSLIEDGLNAEMDALNESIDKVKQNLSDASSLREYQKNIEKQTKNIASLERQISARSGDMSEKGRADVQKLKVQLENAKSELEDTEYDKYVEDQERILDDMSDDFQKYLDGQLDQIDELLNNISTSIQNGEANILPILEKLGDTIGIDLSKIFSGNLSGFASTGKTDAGGVYENTKETYENSANEEFNQAANTPVMNTDENKGQMELNALAKDPAYQKTSAWLKSKGFSDNDVNRMYTSLGAENAQALFTGVQGAGGNPNSEDIFNKYGEALDRAHMSGKETPDAFSSYKETDAYANIMKAKEEKRQAVEEREKKARDRNKRIEDNRKRMAELAEIFTKVRNYQDNKEQATSYLYGSQLFANKYGKGYKNHLSITDAKNADALVEQMVNVDTGKPMFDSKMFDSKNGEKILKAICKLDKDYGGVLKKAVAKDKEALKSIGGVGGFSKGGIVDSKTMSKIADKNGDDAWVTVKSGEGILSPIDTQNLLALTDTYGKLNSSRLLTTENIMPRRSVSANNNVYGGVNIHLDGSDIKDFATFETAFQNAAKKSTKLRNTILDVATSGMTGDTNAFMRR